MKFIKIQKPPKKIYMLPVTSLFSEDEQELTATLQLYAELSKSWPHIVREIHEVVGVSRLLSLVQHPNTTISTHSGCIMEKMFSQRKYIPPHDKSTEIIETIRQTIPTHTKDSGLLAIGINILSRLMSYPDTEVIDALCDALLDFALEAMRLHTMAPDVQSASCILMAECCKFEDFPDHFGLRGGISQVIGAMGRHPQELNVQLNGIMCLFYASRRKPVCKTLGDRRYNNVSIIIQALKTHRDIVDLQEWGSMLLGALESPEDLEPMLEIMKAYPQNRDIQESGVDLILALSKTHKPPVSELLCEVLIRMFENRQMERYIIDKCTWAIRRIVSNDYMCRPLLVSKGVIHAILDAAGPLHPGARNIMAVLDIYMDHGAMYIFNIPPTYLRIDYNFICSVTQRWIPNIHTLTLRHYERLDELDIMCTLAACPTLTTLSIVRIQFADDAAIILSKSKSIESLNISNTFVGDQGVSALCSMTSLRNLNLDNTMVTNHGVRMLEQSMSLRKTSVSGTSVDSAALESLEVTWSSRPIRLKSTLADLWILRRLPIEIIYLISTYAFET